MKVKPNDLIRIIQVLSQYGKSYKATEGEIIWFVNPSRLGKSEVEMLKELGANPVHDFYFLIS